MDSIGGEPPVLLNGTVEQVHEQFHALRAKFKRSAQFNSAQDLASPQSEGSIMVDRRPVKRGLGTKLFPRIDCGEGRFGWKTVSMRDAFAGIRNLKLAKGRPKSAPGPGQCARVSCSGEAGIWWCNDVSHLSNHFPPSTLPFGHLSFPPKLPVYIPYSSSHNGEK